MQHSEFQENRPQRSTRRYSWGSGSNFECKQLHAAAVIFRIYQFIHCHVHQRHERFIARHGRSIRKQLGQQSQSVFDRSSPFPRESTQKTRRNSRVDRYAYFHVGHFQSDNNVLYHVPNQSGKKWKERFFAVDSLFFSFQATKYSDYGGVYKCLAAYVVIVTQVAGLCVTGQRTTTKCASIALEFYQLQWYRFPIDVQKMAILMMKQSQKPFIYKGNSMTQCILPTLAEVSHFWGVECKSIALGSVLEFAVGGQRLRYASHSWFMK